MLRTLFLTEPLPRIPKRVWKMFMLCTFLIIVWCISYRYMLRSSSKSVLKVTSYRQTDLITDIYGLRLDSVAAIGNELHTFNIRKGGNSSTRPVTKVITPKRQRYLFYLCGGKLLGCGGWADRLKGIIITYLMSQVTNRTFGISVTHPSCDLTRYLRPNRAAWNITISDDTLKRNKNSVGYLRVTDSKEFYHAVQTMNFENLFQKDIEYFQANLDYVTLFKNNSRYWAHTSWMRNLTRSKIYRKLFDELFSLAPDLQAELSALMKKAKPTDSHQLICSQIRMGRNPSNPHDTLVSTERLVDVPKIWQFLEKYRDPAKYRIYVTSDSEDIRKEARSRFGSILVENEGPSVHIDKFTDTNNVCAGMRKVILDQQILAQCDVFLLTKSGLGRTSAYLRQKETGLFCLVMHNILKCYPDSLKELYNVYG